MAKRNISLPDDVDALLSRVGNISGYLADSVRDRWRDWQESLATLSSIGWTGREILAAADVLNGYWLLHASPLGPSLALELHDAAALNRVHAKWQIPGETWQERVLEVRDQEPVARALWCLVREYWNGNEELERRLRDGRPAG